MARYLKSITLNTIRSIGVVPVFYNSNIEIAKEVLKACYMGGAKVIEMTNRGDGAINVFQNLYSYAVKEFPEIILGVGSIIDAPTAALYIAQGANFVVGPVIDEETAILCNSRKIPYSPGCGSVSEIHRAHKLGVDLIKVFPGSQVGGPSFVEAVLGPCPWTEIMPTGGVNPTEKSLQEWFLSGIVSVGMGSKLITREIINERDFLKLTEDVRNVISLIQEIRKKIGK